MGWVRLVQAPAHLFANRLSPLSEIWGDRADRLRAALAEDADDTQRVRRLDALLLGLLAAAPPPEPHLAAIHRALVSGDITTVSAFAAEVGVTQRTLERLCPKLFGFAPKPLLRRQRFLRTLDRVVHNPGRTLTELLEVSYADQSHFVREFRAFMGLTPTAYFAEPRTMMRLAGAERERVLGQTMQGLHQPPA
jgi:AraC-like DNA-binding protein